MILYRPVGLKEMELIYDSGMRSFPARLPQQPIFYPVLQLEYARQIASDWNTKSGQSAGYVTQFKVEDQYISQFETHTVGSSQHQEFWIPAEELEKFNQHITGHLKVLEAHFGDAFQGFVPESFGLQGKNAVEQFTLLANSYLYKRMDFYLEIKRNHKAVFLNYPFWQTYAFKNPGLKEKVLKAVKEAWLTSFPKIPLPSPVHEDALLVKPPDSPVYSLADPVQEDLPSLEHSDPYPLVKPVHKDTPPIKHTDAHAQSFVKPVREESKTPLKQSYAQSLVNPAEDQVSRAKRTDPPAQSLANAGHQDATPVEESDSEGLESSLDEEFTFEEKIDSRSSVTPVREDNTPVDRTDSHRWVNPVHDTSTPAKPTVSHFSRGRELGLSGQLHEAIDELSMAVKEDPDDVVAYTSLGVAFHRLGEDDRALSCYEEALTIDPNDAEAHYFRANILYAQGNVREAIAGYTIAIGLKPELIRAHEESVPQDRLTDYTRSPAEMHRIARPAHRILDLNKSLETNNRQADLYKQRAAEYYRLWNYEQAIADYSSSLAIQSADADVLHLRGVAYEQLRQFDHALEDYRQAVAIDPQLPDLYIQRGVEFGKMGHFRQSIASLTEGLRLAPRSADAYFNRGTSYVQLGDFERAIEDFSMVIQLAPNDEAAYYWRGISNEESGRRDEAIADYSQFLEISQDPSVRQEIEQKLRRWKAGKRNVVSGQHVIPDDRQKADRAPLEEPGQDLDLYSLIAALGERALNSTWFGSGVECYGEKADELYALTDHNQPIQGGDFLSISSGIRQIVAGDFQGFDPDATSHWIFIRAWEGSGFYIEINDRKSKEGLKIRFPSVEEVEGASPPYESLFIRI